MSEKLDGYDFCHFEEGGSDCICSKVDELEAENYKLRSRIQELEHICNNAYNAMMYAHSPASEEYSESVSELEPIANKYIEDWKAKRYGTANRAKKGG